MTNGEKIRCLRRDKNYTITEIAAILGVSETTLGRYEREQAELPGREFEQIRLIIESLPRKHKEVRKDKFFLRAEKYNIENPLKYVEDIYLSALFLAIQNPHWFQRSTEV